jgi:hypothetical protein
MTAALRLAAASSSLSRSRPVAFSCRGIFVAGETFDIDGLRVDRLRFHDGAPVRAASAIVGLGDGWLVAQDDANHVAWHRPGHAIARVRLFPTNEGVDSFSPSDGTKHLKPDIEVACRVVDRDGADAALLLGSGSTARRMRAALVRLGPGGPTVETSDLASLYRRVAQVLGIEVAALNLEGAAVLDGSLHLFNRGTPAADVPSQSVILEVAALMDAWRSPNRIESLVVGAGSVYDLGNMNGVGLALTDAVAIGQDLFLMSAAAEDTPNAYDDGPVVGSALALADVTGVRAVTALPHVHGAVAKVVGNWPSQVPLRCFKAVGLVRRVAERLVRAGTASTEGDTTAAIDFLTVGTDDCHVALHEQRPIGAERDGHTGGGGRGGFRSVHEITVDECPGVVRTGARFRPLLRAMRHMRAVLTTGHGGFEKLMYREDVAVPAVGPFDVLIAVGAAAVNATDINTRVGWYSQGDDDTGWTGEPLQFPRIQGIDACGRIVEVGDRIDRGRIGQRVVVEPAIRETIEGQPDRVRYLGSELDGAFAEYVVVP